LSNNKSVSIAFKRHDHERCSDTALKTAEDYCKKHNLQLTPTRRKVLELLLEAHRAIGAYSLLDLLKEAGFRSQPTVAYRALDFLVEHGFAHKIQRLNAFLACTHPGTAHSPAFMICRRCETVAETNLEVPGFNLTIDERSLGFKIEQTVIEAQGLCHSCTGIT
jgi:Fur family zinc uptake transcriptional regulator